MANRILGEPLREPTLADIEALPASIAISSSAGTVEVRIDRKRLFVAFAAHFDRRLATGPSHPNFEQTFAREVKLHASRDEALHTVAVRHRAAVRMYAFHALREFITNADHADELFKSWFQFAMGRTHAELRNTAMETASGDLFAFLDHDNAELRAWLLDRSAEPIRKGWKAPIGGDRRSKLKPDTAKQFVRFVQPLSKLWSAISAAVGSATNEAEAVAIASNVAVGNRVHVSHFPIIEVVAPLLVRRGVSKPNRAPQALAALHAAIATENEQADFASHDAGLTAPSRWNRIYQRHVKRGNFDDNQSPP